MLAEQKDVIIDGRHCLWRCADAFRMLSVKLDGEDFATGGIYGFLTCCLRVKQVYGGVVRVAWEGTDNFRHKLFPGYKARERTPAEEEQISSMSTQEKALNEVLTACGVEQAYGVRCEADDVIGTIAATNRMAGRNTLIYSGDSDLRQLVRDASEGLGWIRTAQPRKNKDTIFDEVAVKEKDGVTPNRIAHLKAIAGDSSDKIPGAPGLGPKAAISILEAYGDTPKALEVARAFPTSTDISATYPKWPLTERQYQIFRDAADDVELYLKLTKIRVHANMTVIPGKKDVAALSSYLKTYQFRSLASPLERSTLLRLSVEK